MAIGLAVRCKRVGEASDLGSTTVEVPKPFVKEVSNEGKPLTTSLVSCQGRFCALLEPGLLHSGSLISCMGNALTLRRGGGWGGLQPSKSPAFAVPA